MQLANHQIIKLRTPQDSIYPKPTPGRDGDLHPPKSWFPPMQPETELGAYSPGRTKRLRGYILKIALNFIFLVLFILQTPCLEASQINNILRLDPTLDYNLVASAGYITNKDPKIATITSAAQEKLSLYLNDIVYLDRGAQDGVELGETYVVFRLDNNVINPATTLTLGRKLKIIGFLQVISLESSWATGIITAFYDLIYRGDSIGSINEVIPPWHYSLFLALKKDTNRRGRIIDSRESREILGKSDIVYLNLGRDDGIGPGHRFRILRTADPISPEERDFKRTIEREIGEGEVISSQEKTSTAIIKDSREEISPLETVEAKMPGNPSR